MINKFIVHKFGILLLTFSLMLFVRKSSNAQQKWTLQKCIQYALENSIQIKQYALNLEANKGMLLQSKAELLPRVNGFVSHTYSYGRLVDPYTNEFTNNNVQSNNISLSAEMNLFRGGQLYNTIKQSEFNFLSSLQEMQKASNDVALTIASLYLQILYNNEMLILTEKQVEISKSQVERTKKLYDAGSVAKGNLLEIQAQLASDELQQINAQNQLTDSYLTIKQTLEYESDSVFEIESPQLAEISDNIVLDNVETIFANAQTLPEIQSAELKIKSASSSIKIARSYAVPSLSLYASIGSGYSDARQKYSLVPSANPREIGYLESNPLDKVYALAFDQVNETYPFMDQVKDNQNTSIALRLSIPIFNNFQVKNSVSKSKIAYQNAQYTLQLTKNQVYKDIQKAHNAAMASISRYFGSKKAFEATQESFTYATQKYELGLYNSIDYNLIKNQLIKSESEMLQAKYEFYFRKSVLNFYQGKPLEIE